jgi:hypothetical protein
MNVEESAFSQFVFENHAESPSIVGGMPMTKLLANKRFVGGRAMDYDYIDKEIAKLSNSRFDNLVVPVGFYVERDHNDHKSRNHANDTNNQYITPFRISDAQMRPPVSLSRRENDNWCNEDVFENLFGIIIREPKKHNKSINNKTKSKNRDHKQSSKKARK